MLVEASSNLISKLELEAVLPAILDLSRRLIAADAYAVWRFDLATGTWGIAATAGLSPAYQQQMLQSYGRRRPFDRPILAEDIETSPAVARRVDDYRREGICSLLVVPLTIHGQAAGSIAFYYRQPRQFSPIEVRIATALANIAAATIGSAELYEEQRRLRTAAEQAQQRSAFLAEVSDVLASSLDYETTLQSVAYLAVPQLADWCTVEVPDAQGGLRVLARAHDDPAKIALAEEVRRSYPPDLSAAQGLPGVLRSGRAALVAQVTESMLVAEARDAAHLTLLRQLGIASIMFVPLVARGRPIGVLTLAMAESGRHYGPTDLDLAEELARRAGIAVDNAQLYQEAQQAIRLREEFLSIASHELKTPLTGLQLQGQMLIQLARKGTLATLPPERILAMLERSDRQGKQLVKLINTLLDISRITAGRLELEREEVDLAEVVRSVAERFGAELANAQAALTLQADTPVVGNWDRSRVEQVVTNLLANAIKYGLGRPITLATGVDADTAWLLVRDEGIGIAAADQERIFERFARAVDMRNYGGFGLGLYIVRQIVEAHGGTIAVTSAAGAGATFRVTLPLRDAPAPSVPKEE